MQKITILVIKHVVTFIANIIWLNLVAFTGKDFNRFSKFIDYHLDPYSPLHPELVKNHKCLIHN